MYCDSYNQYRKKATTEADYFTAKAYNENSTYGYIYKPAHANTSPNSDGYGHYTDYTNYAIQTATASGMYRPNNQYPWLASPSFTRTASVCRVNGGNGYLEYSDTTATFGVRPAVSLPADIQIQLVQ